MRKKKKETGIKCIYRIKLLTDENIQKVSRKHQIRLNIISGLLE